MPDIIILKPFRHCVGTDIHATEFAPVPGDAPQSVDETTARVAIAEGWAAPFDQAAPAKKTGRRSRKSGPAAPSSSSPGAPASSDANSNTSD